MCSSKWVILECIIITWGYWMSYVLIWNIHDWSQIISGKGQNKCNDIPAYSHGVVRPEEIFQVWEFVVSRPTWTVRFERHCSSTGRRLVYQERVTLGRGLHVYWQAAAWVFSSRVCLNEEPTALHPAGRGTIVLFVQVERLRIICAALHVIELFCYFFLPHLYGF